MQHDGWLETLIYAKYPPDDLVFRNLAAAGDEVATWHRSENFGSRDEWLTKTKADVIFAFYGFNESFKGTTGLDKFKQDLDKFLKHTQAANYSGKGAPRIVLFSPIANERHQDPNFPDPRNNNENILLYTAAMAEVALAEPLNGTVDLAGPEPIRQDDLVRRFLKATGDGRTVVTDPGALYYGIALNDQSLTPGAHPRLGSTRFEDWLRHEAVMLRAIGVWKHQEVRRQVNGSQKYESEHKPPARHTPA
jgi:hypothetical protein